MVVLLNSAKFNRTILALLPPYCRTHYQFLKDRFPDYFPDLDWEGTGVTSEGRTLKADRKYSSSLQIVNLKVLTGFFFLPSPLLFPSEIQLFLVNSVQR